MKGRFSRTVSSGDGLWNRVIQSCRAVAGDSVGISAEKVELPWYAALSVFNDFLRLQSYYGFKFSASNHETRSKLKAFIEQQEIVKRPNNSLRSTWADESIEEALQAVGFTKRQLTRFQMRDLQKLLSLHHGANFSVPGAGKTTVTLALHLLTRSNDWSLLVVSPKSAFPAWTEVVQECVSDDAENWVRKPFQVLANDIRKYQNQSETDSRKFVINYEQVIARQDEILGYLATERVHLVLDESHRIKGGEDVQRAAVLLRGAPFPVRRDILTGTPMPQSVTDLQSQLRFLWPGSNIDREIANSPNPGETIGNLYVRTTKRELGLPEYKRSPISVEMTPSQAALYGIVRNEALLSLSGFSKEQSEPIRRAKRSVMRLLQLSVNPELVIDTMSEETPEIRESGVIRAVIDDGPAPKLVKTRDMARSLASQRRKVVIWTIFTNTIHKLLYLLADLNPVAIHGSIPSGDVEDENTREGKLRKFKNDDSCFVLIANPAAAAEGISLHTVCHDAIYVDRSYNATHYLQSLDRIHRLGLPPNVETTVYVLESVVPQGLGSIDFSVSRRLSAKLNNLSELLNDDDLRQLTLDEDHIEDDWNGLTRDDIGDLILELRQSTTSTSGL